MPRKSILVYLTNRYAQFVPPYPEKELNAFFSFHPPGYLFMPLYRMGAWDGRIKLLKNGFMAAGLFHALIDDFRNDFPELGNLEVERDFEEIDFHKKGLVSDRQYQNDCVGTMVHAANAFGGGLVLGATGTGKTYMAAMFFSRLVGSAVFVVDQLDLLKQARKEIAEHLKEEVGEVGDSIFNPKRITIATVQTLHLHRKKPQFKRWMNSIKVIVVDEVHVAMNRRNFDVVASAKPPAVFGLTATLELKKKPIRMRAYALTGPVIYEYSLEQATKEKFVTKGCVVQLLHEHEDDGEGQSYFDLYKSLIVKSRARNNLVERLVRISIKKKKYVIVLVERISHLKILAKRLEDIPHRVVCGLKEVEERQQSMREFEAAKIRLIIANKVFKKGINLKRVDIIIDAAALKSKNDAIQKFGRGVRLCGGKEGLIYFDIGDLGNRFEKPAGSRRRAFKAKGIPLKKLNSGKIEQAFKVGERLLASS